MLLNDISRRHAIFVGGKGGVGKTSLASAIALARAQTGSRVLVASTDPAHNLGHLWEQPVGDDIVTLWDSGGSGRVDGVEIDPHRTVDAHLAAVGETMTRLLPERLHRAALDHLESARDAPGTHEAAVLERIAETLETGLDHYDLVVFDTAPSGHTLHLLAMPDKMTGWTEKLLANRDRSERFAVAYGALGGTKDTSDRDAELRRMLLRRKARFSLMRDSITDPIRTGFVLVTVAEPMPIAESRDVAASLASLGVSLAGVVANRLSPADLMPKRREREEALLASLDLGAPITRIPLIGELIGLPALELLSRELTIGPPRN